MSRDITVRSERDSGTTQITGHNVSNGVSDRPMFSLVAARGADETRIPYPTATP